MLDVKVAGFRVSASVLAAGIRLRSPVNGRRAGSRGFALWVAGVVGWSDGDMVRP